MRAPLMRRDSLPLCTRRSYILRARERSSEQPQELRRSAPRQFQNVDASGTDSASTCTSHLISRDYQRCRCMISPFLHEHDTLVLFRQGFDDRVTLLAWRNPICAKVNNPWPVVASLQCRIERRNRFNDGRHFRCAHHPKSNFRPFFLCLWGVCVGGART